MGMTNEDAKQALIGLLSEESVQVLQVAYIYAKHYVDYGEDITKAFSNAVVQASMLQKVRQKAFVEAYDSFKKDYEASLKSDMVAMLEEFDLKLSEYEDADLIRAEYIRQEIQEKIDELKGRVSG